MNKRYRLLAFLLALALTLPVTAAQSEHPVRIAIIDTGISSGAISSNQLDTGYNYVLPGHSTEDVIGHGTAVASIIVGCESAGISGIYPEAILIPLVVYSKDSDGKKVRCNGSDLSAVVRDAVDKFDCDIINMSLTSSKASPELEESLAYAREQGVIIVASSGNEGNATLNYPAGYDTAISVGSINSEGSDRAKFSNFNQALDLMAPGADITIADIHGNAVTGSGTSYSVPCVTAAAAKLMDTYPTLTGEQITQILLASATDIRYEGYDMQTGWGKLDLENALHYAAQGRQFRDASPDQWYFDGVKYMSTQGLMKGTDAVNFSPNQTTTRAMMWVMLYRVDGQTESGSGAEWYSDAQNWVKSNNIADGAAPGQIITREEIAAMLYQYSIYKGRDVSAAANLISYSDASSVSKNTVDAMKWACGTGIINGMYGALNPQGSATRAQIATILMRFINL